MNWVLSLGFRDNNKTTSMNIQRCKMLINIYYSSTVGNYFNDTIISCFAAINIFFTLSLLQAKFTISFLFVFSIINFVNPVGISFGLFNFVLLEEGSAHTICVIYR